MHFDWNVSFGQLIISVPIFWLIVMIAKLYHMMLRFRIEHEILMRFWADAQTPPMKLEDLPTRQTKWW